MFPFIIQHLSLSVPWSHFHFPLHVCLLDSEQVIEQKHFGCQWQGVIPELKVDVLSVRSVQVVLIFSLLHSVTAKCSRQKSNKTGSQSCSWGQEGHRSLCWHVGHISQMTEAQLESSKWLRSDVGDRLHMVLITSSLKLGRPGLGLVCIQNDDAENPEPLDHSNYTAL